ncbi:MAG: homoserine O-acetyltransferase [Bacteroidales bacterium]|nr:homoserine O-acetyltransferase [Bacteroidales bacterium]
MKVQKVKFNELLPLEDGSSLPEVTIAFHTYGTLNENGDNVIWVCHALTANSDVAEWWPGMLGKGLLFDPDTHFIVCANILGSCYGSTGPASINPETEERYGRDFPLVTVRDIVKGHQLLRNHLGITKIQLITGGSLGGQQALEWAYSEPELFEFLVPIATNAISSPWGIAFNESQRMALESDPDFIAGRFTEKSAGLRAARSIALISYRNAHTYNKTQEDPDAEKLENFKVSSYQQYQGLKLEKRFDPFSYYAMSKALDSQNVGRARGGVEAALKRITTKTHAIGIRTDLLFPVEEQKRIAKGIPGAKFTEIDSFYGHDGFLLEYDAISAVIKDFIKS